MWTCYVFVSCITLLHKSSAGFDPLLTRCELVMLLSYVLRFYTSCLLTLLCYWLVVSWSYLSLYSVCVSVLSCLSDLFTYLLLYLLYIFVFDAF